MLFILVALISSKLVFLAFSEHAFWTYVADVLIITATALYTVPSFFTKNENFKVALILILFLFILIISETLTSIIYGDDWFVAISDLSRTISPLFMLGMLLTPRAQSKIQLDSIQYHSILFLVISTIILIIYGVNFLPGDVNRGKLWFGTIFGGLHESSFILASVLFLTFSLYVKMQRNSIFILYFLSLIFTIYMVTIGWGVKTVSVVVLLFQILFVFDKVHIKPLYSFLFISWCSISIFLLLFNFEVISSTDITYISSGRTDMYVEKIHYLSKNSLLDWLLGNGYRSDLMLSNIWWWDEKGSHNDFLTLLTENGLVFITAFCVLLLFIFRNINNRYARIIFGLAILSSMISNGYLTRPAPSYVLFLSIAILSSTRTSGNPIDQK